MYNIEEISVVMGGEARMYIQLRVTIIGVDPATLKFWFMFHDDYEDEDLIKKEMEYLRIAIIHYGGINNTLVTAEARNIMDRYLV